MEEILAMASEDELRVELIRRSESSFDEVFRVHLDSEKFVDLPVDVFRLMHVVGRRSYVLPAALFGDRQPVVDRLDRLLAK